MIKLILIITLPLLLLIGGFFWLSQPVINHLVIDKPVNGQLAEVVRVIDGDTIVVKYNNHQYPVRLIGIDTPETVDPHRVVGCFGKQASNTTKHLLVGRMVYLVADLEDQDKYQRQLRYVYLPVNHDQLLFVNDYLMRTGQAKILTIEPNNKFAAQLNAAQLDAQQQRLGLWMSC